MSMSTMLLCLIMKQISQFGPHFYEEKNFTYELFEEEYLLLVIKKNLILNKSEYTLCIFWCESGFKKK